MRNRDVLALLAAQQAAHAEELKAVLAALKPESAPFLQPLPQHPYFAPPPEAPAGRYIVDDDGVNGFYVPDGNVAPVDLSMFPSPWDLIREEYEGVPASEE